MASYRGHFIPFNELADMHLMLGRCNGQSNVASKEYALLYPNRINPGRQYFDAIDRRMRENGTLVPRIEGRGKQVCKKCQKMFLTLNKFN